MGRVLCQNTALQSAPLYFNSFVYSDFCIYPIVRCDIELNVVLYELQHNVWIVQADVNRCETDL